MTESALVLRQVLASRSPEDVTRIVRNLGFSGSLWQSWDPQTVHTWDDLPNGFFAHYYGIDADKHCAVATAIRRGWMSFTFKQARRAFGDLPGAADAERVWDAFNIRDGVVIVCGRAARKAVSAFMTPRAADPLMAEYGEALSLAAIRLDGLLSSNTGVIAIPRPPVQLTPRQIDVLRIQIDNPDLPFAEQAKRLGISPRMLAKRHQQIAARFGVSSFAGAVAKASAQSSDLGQRIAAPVQLFTSTD